MQGLIFLSQAAEENLAERACWLGQMKISIKDLAIDNYIKSKIQRTCMMTLTLTAMECTEIR